MKRLKTYEEFINESKKSKMMKSLIGNDKKKLQKDARKWQKGKNKEGSPEELELRAAAKMQEDESVNEAEELYNVIDKETKELITDTPIRKSVALKLAAKKKGWVIQKHDESVTEGNFKWEFEFKDPLDKKLYKALNQDKVEFGTSHGQLTVMGDTDKEKDIAMAILKKFKISESVNEAKNTIGLAFKDEGEYKDFKEFAEENNAKIYKDKGFDSKTKSWYIEMEEKQLAHIYGDIQSGNKNSGWMAIKDDFESVIVS